MLKTRLITFITPVVLCLTFSLSYAAPLRIEITQGVDDAQPIAIVPFEEIGNSKAPENIASIVNADLSRTGRFKAFPVKDMLEKPHEGGKVNFKNWRVLGIDNLVVGKVKHLGADRYMVSFWLMDIFKGKQLLAFNVQGHADNMRNTAHKISDIIYEKLTGQKGAFQTRIAYITSDYEHNKRFYSLWIADSDGANAETLLHSPEPVMSPNWSPDGKKIAYASLEQGGRQRIFVQEWQSGKRNEIKIGKKGLYGAPSWSPDGKKLAFAVTWRGNAEIYVLDMESKKSRILTKHWAIDTEPAWTPDGSSIIFTSDRGGRPQLYQVPAEGGRVKRLTFEGRENARAAVAPDGKSIAMVQKNGGKYQIAVMELSTGNMRVLTDGILDESPSFAPNGSMIIYATATEEMGALAAVSIDGRVHQKLSYQDDVREPAWSPFKQ